MKPVALITGVTGQDGALLSEFLLNKGYEVHGIKRRSSSLNTARIDHLFREVQDKNSNFFLHYGDMTDSSNLTRLLHDIQPNEIYNLAAQSHVMVSFETPEYTANADAMGTLRLLEAIRTLENYKDVRFYQASTSEMFGSSPPPQNEETPFHPLSPYGVSKLFAYWMVVNYRKAYGMHASNGILFNHESPLRGETFVSRKITRAVAEISLGYQDCLYLGNLNALRDWGFAGDYVEGMWKMLQQPTPDDYVLATGKSISVRKFVEKAFAFVGIPIEWCGKGIEEVGVNTNNEKTIVRIDPRYFRPNEVHRLRGDATKAKEILDWEPKTTVDELIEMMVKSDLHEVKTLLFMNKHIELE